jgi:hypothetical protein
MSELQRPGADDEAAEDTESSGETVSITVEDTTASVVVPDDATRSEAAAIASAVGAHLQDRALAAAAAQQDDGPELTDEWKLAGRLRSQGKRRFPKHVERGEEWKAAARSFY